MITIGAPNVIGLRSFVPIDDHNAMLISQNGQIHKPMREEESMMRANVFDEVGGYIERTNDPRSYFLTKANKRNDFMRNREVEKESMFNGVPFVMNLQDRAMTELMCDAEGQPIYDRTQEHLGSSDAMVIAVRKQLLHAVVRLHDGGGVPANVDNVMLDRVRSASLRSAGGRRLEKHQRGCAQCRLGSASRGRLAIDHVEVGVRPWCDRIAVGPCRAPRNLESAPPSGSDSPRQGCVRHCWNRHADGRPEHSAPCRS